jgi:hypothetical protein
MLVDSSQISGPCTARVVKYIAKSAAKNINSDESQTIVPTATRFGRFTLCELKALEALDMRGIIAENTLKLTSLAIEFLGITTQIR